MLGGFFCFELRVNDDVGGDLVFVFGDVRLGVGHELLGLF